jgi:hypothetical protein
MTKALLVGVLTLLCAGCAGPAIASRAIGGEANWFVRLDTFTDARASADLRFEHPAQFTEAELATILSRVQVQERAGMLERKPFPQPLFTGNEIRRMVPGLQRALRSAQPAEWVVFYSILPAGIMQEVTSGGLFIRGDRLHVVVANHHDRIPSGSDGLAAIRANPLSPWGGKGVTLSFDPVRFVSATQATWMGGSSAAPASELVLDHRTFLAEAGDAAVSPVTAPPVLPAPAPGAQIPVPLPQAAQAAPQAAAVDPGDTGMKEQVTGLQAEVERLRRRVEEQDDEIAQLKTRLIELDNLMKGPPKKKPGR